MRSIFETTKIPNGYSCTIVSKLGHILRIAEERYGKRDTTYTILGIELTNQGCPQIWYPGDCKHIVIQITEECLKDMNHAVFQVAHEAIHCLSPTGKNDANVLEEGLANLFSIEYCRENGHGSNWQSTDQAYTNASNLVEALLKFDRDIIKKLRVIESTISNITKDTIWSVNSSIPVKLVDDLTKKFK